MQNGSGDGYPEKWGQFTSLANPSCGDYFCFIKGVVNVIRRGIVQRNYRRNQLLRRLKPSKGLDQSLAINSVKCLFEVKA